MGVSKNDILNYIIIIWYKVYPLYIKDKSYLRIIKALSCIKKEVEQNIYEDYGYLNALLRCIDSSLNIKSSIHNQLYNYVHTLEKLTKKTYLEWVLLFNENKLVNT